MRLSTLFFIAAPIIAVGEALTGRKSGRKVVDLRKARKAGAEALDNAADTVTARVKTAAKKAHDEATTSASLH